MWIGMLQRAECRSPLVARWLSIPVQSIAGNNPLCVEWYVKCQRQILSIRWQDHVRNIEVTNQTGIPPVMERVVKCHNSIFGLIARMPHTVPAHQALHCQVELSLGRLPDSSWKRRPGRPNKRWLDQIRDNNNHPAADVWRDAVRRGHFGATQRSTPT